MVNIANTFRPAYERRGTLSREVCVLCLLISGLFYLTAAINTAGAATYYLDAVNGNDSNPGTQALPWKTLNKAQATTTGGDTVLVRNGSYGAFTDVQNRADWLVWRADTGHTPEFDYIKLGDFGHQDLDSYLEFDGIKIDGVDVSLRAVSLYTNNYVNLKNCIFTGQGYEEYDKSNGVLLYHCSQVTIDNCTITESEDVVEGGYETGVYGRYSHDITVQDCNISGAAIAIVGWGERWTITRNVLHDLDSDGIYLASNKDTTVSDNTIYNVYAPIHFTYDGGCSYNDANATITADSGDPFVKPHFTYYIRLTRDGQEASDWYIIDSHTSSTITLTESIGGGDYNDIVLIEVKKGYHCDGIQAGQATMGEAETSIITNLNILRNTIYNIDHQGIFFNFPGVAGVSDITYENNLVYNLGGTYVDITNQANVVFRGNTIPKGSTLFRGTCSNMIITSNIMCLPSIYETEDVNTENYNVLWQWWGPHDGDHVAGGNDIVYGAGDEAGFKALFTDYDNNDFTLAGGSAAIDFGNPTYAPSTDILGNPRDAAPDAGCYESNTSDPNNPTPELQAIGDKFVDENVTLTFDVNAIDPNGEPITYSAQGLPSGATLDLQTGDFAWTPSYQQAGSYQVTFRASDGNSWDSQIITITVNNVNRAPVIGAITDQSVDENALLSIPVEASDPDGQALAYSISGLPAGAVFASQTFTWTPSYDQAGTFPVTFTADDGQAQDSQAITITVINVNRTPVLTAINNQSVWADDPLTFTIDATDPDGDTVTYSAGTLPTGATFTGQDFDWTPSQGQMGSYDVTFLASDGQLQDSQMVTITVDVDSLAPTVTNLSPAIGAIQVPLNNLITLDVTDAGKGIEPKSVKIKVRINSNPNNTTVYFGDMDHYISLLGDCRRIGNNADYKFVFQPTQDLFYYDQTVTITVNATDLAGNVMNEYSYSFATEMHSFGQNKQVNSGLGNNDRPVTVCDSSGNIWTAWHAGSIGNRDIYVSKLTSGEENFGGTVQLTDNTTDQCNPALALDSNDKLYVVWQDNREGDWDIYLSTSVDGISWSTETRVNDPNEGNQVNPAIAIDGQTPNQAHVVWQDDLAGNQDICIAASSDGFATKTISQITTDSFDQVEPAVTADSANTIYVIWMDVRNGSNDIYGAASNNPWTNVAIVSNAYNQSSPTIAAESTGSILHFLWVDDTLSDNDIYYTSSNGLPGSPLTGSSIIDDSSGADQLEPTIAVTGSTGNNLKVFACWQDWRNTDTDLYFAELSSSSGTNVFVGDGGSSTYQGEPIIGIDEYSHPYLIWADNRSTNTEIYYAGSTFVEPVTLASELVAASAPSSTTVGADPQAITTVDDVSVVVPAGACSYDVAITVTKIANPQTFAAPCLGGYDFGPSGIQFSQPVTITIPYSVSESNGSTLPFWYNSLTGTLSQEGITDVQDIVISPTLHALSFETTHFTAFYLLGGGAGVLGGGGGGGCSLSAGGEGNIVEFILPYIVLVVVMAILKVRDARNRKVRSA